MVPLAAALSPFLSNVKRLEISLFFEGRCMFWDGPEGNPYSTLMSCAVIDLGGHMAGSAVRSLATMCKNLTSLTVCGTCISDHCRLDDFNLLPLLQALHDVSLTSQLLSLKVSVNSVGIRSDRFPGVCFTRIRLGSLRDDLTTPSLEQRKAESRILLHRLNALTSLELSGGSITNTKGWLALPSNLVKLNLETVASAPLQGSCLPFSLQEFVFRDCDSTFLAGILDDSRALRCISLQCLRVETCNKRDASNIFKIFTHPLLSSKNRNQVQPNSNASCPNQHIDSDNIETHPASSCIIRNLQLQITDEDDLLLMDFLPLLPMMAAVLEFHIWNSGPSLPADITLASFKQIPLILPQVKSLFFSDLEVSDEAATTLQSCPSLRNLILRKCGEFCSERIAAWRLLLPDLVEFKAVNNF